MKIAFCVCLTAVSALAAPPVFTAHPVDIVWYDGQAGTLSANSSDSTATYQWRKNGANLSGQTGKNLAFTGIVAADAGDYDCVVTNADGSSQHPPARLTVLTGVAPILRTTVQAAQRVAGESFGFSASAVGSLPMTYQWLKNGVGIDRTTNSWNLSPITAADAATYTVRVSNAHGTVTGAPIQLTVMPVQPANLCGVPFVKLADTHTIKPGRPGVKFKTFSKPKLRDGILYFLAEDGAQFEYGVYRWQNGAFSIVADETITAPDGTPFADCRYPTEETGGTMAFGARTGGTVAGGSLIIYNAATGTHTQPAKYGDAAPGGGRFYGFGHLAKRGSTVYWGGLTFEPGRSAVWKWDGSAITEEFSDTTVLPGGGKFSGVPGTNPQFAFDGNFLAFGAVTTAPAGGGIYVKPASGGAITRIWNASANRPGAGSGDTTYGGGVPDIDGGSVFIGGDRYNAVAATDGMVISEGGTKTVDASGPDSYLRVTPTGLDLELITGGEARPWTNASTATVAVIPAPSPNAIKEISGHGKSAAIVLGHPSNRDDVTDSLWLAHNGTSAVTAPVITWNPPDYGANIGSRLSLRVIASGGGLTWEWRLNGNVFPGNADGDLVLNPFTAAHAGTWTVNVSNSMGSASATFTLTSASPVTLPVFVGSLPSRRVLPGVGVFFAAASIVHPGGGVISYQWFKNGVLIPGATVSTFSINPVQPSHAGQYTVRVTNAAGSVTSNVAALTVGDAAAPAPAPLTVTQVGGVVTISFPTVDGRSYRLEESAILNGGWNTVETFSGNGSPKTWNYTGVTGRKFYRVVDITP